MAPWAKVPTPGRMGTPMARRYGDELHALMLVAPSIAAQPSVLSR